MQNKIIGVIAPKGSGKTHAVAEMVEREMQRVVIFDLVMQPLYLCAEPVIGQPRRLVELMAQPTFKVVYVPIIQKRADDDDEAEEYPSFKHVVKLCFLRGDMWLVIDEAHMLCTAHSIPETLLYANRLGRFRRLNLVWITQSFTAVHNSLRQNTDEFWFWKIIEPSDIEGIRKRCGDEVAQRVQALRRLEMTPHGVVPGERLVWNTWQGVVESGVPHPPLEDEDPNPQDGDGADE